MAQGEMIKGLVKPPFANYDIVVYFGCGLFALPFIRHYVIEPFGLRFPIFMFEIGVPFAGLLVSTLSLLFAVYILGHIIAYVGSHLIEKAMEMAFAGKTSDVILTASRVTEEKRKETFRERLRQGRTASWKPHARVAAIARGLAHIPPALTSYWVLVWLGVFGFYTTRVPEKIFDGARERVACMNLGVEIEEGKQWFKAIEGYVINNHPIATARMYNYLVISGLFRSIAVIFLAALWMELIHLGLWGFGLTDGIRFFMSESGGAIRWMFGYAALLAIYLFALFSFLKFQRRYVEEAIFAFVLTKSD